jgi:hypothetical protein
VLLDPGTASLWLASSAVSGGGGPTDHGCLMGNLRVPAWLGYILQRGADHPRVAERAYLMIERLVRAPECSAALPEDVHEEGAHA